jgi:hypothetical protein
MCLVKPLHNKPFWMFRVICSTMNELNHVIFEFLHLSTKKLANGDFFTSMAKLPSKLPEKYANSDFLAWQIFWFANSELCWKSGTFLPFETTYIPSLLLP